MGRREGTTLQELLTTHRSLMLKLTLVVGERRFHLSLLLRLASLAELLVKCRSEKKLKMKVDCLLGMGSWGGVKLAQVSVEDWGMREGERRKECKADMILRVVEMVEQSRETEGPSLRNCHFDRDSKRSALFR